jgi:ornithine carbamoyltransferase
MHNYSGQMTRGYSDFLSITQLDQQDLFTLFALSRDLRSRTMFSDALQGKSVAMIFEKPSLRTRVTFEVAIRQLGGWPVLLGPTESKLGEREAIQDVARNLSFWVDGIVARVFSHRDLEDLALFASVPVVNALSDLEHPCQIISDLLTLAEQWASFAGRELVYIGDWNNVSRSLWRGCSLAGLKFRAICPEKYGPPADEDVEWATSTDDVKGADAIYTDVWASMGQENELAERLEIFHDYQVNEQLLAKTGKDTLFMHCLPAHRGQEVTDAVMESDLSIVFQQAANRLPVEKAILVSFMENSDEAESEEGRSSLFRRFGHLYHHSVAQGKLWM